MSVNTAVAGVPSLPTLDTGVTLLDGSARASGVVHSLVVDHLCIRQGEAVWVDSHGTARTGDLLNLAPSRRFLDRIDVARGFTAYQHRSLLDALATRVDGETALVVVPELDYPYREGDLDAGAADRMLASALDRLRALADEWDVPVLVTRHASGDAVEACADRVLTVVPTRHGPRFVEDSEGAFETLVYRDGRTVQTTIAFWAGVLAERQQAREALRQEVLARGAN
ncbi:hypothetical protein [Halomarina rubra]|uniref:Rad51-like C-terminal domain-containing protein n=1 Tax=Halomarina rubra TaxID=2071873 RepID=A0ABD6AWQ1_9EURY|nr:hypothetical protein [Halomarina rubra]